MAEAREHDAARQLSAHLLQLGFDAGELDARLGALEWAVARAREREEARANARPSAVDRGRARHARGDGPPPAAPRVGDRHAAEADAPDIDELEERREKLLVRLDEVRPEVDVVRLADRQAAIERRVMALEARHGGHDANGDPGAVADIQQHLLGRLTQAATAGPHGDPVPAVLDEVFLRVPAERKWDLLDLLHRLSERHQLIYLSDDPFVAAWASQKAERRQPPGPRARDASEPTSVSRVRRSVLAVGAAALAVDLHARRGCARSGRTASSFRVAGTPRAMARRGTVRLPGTSAPAPTRHSSSSTAPLSTMAPEPTSEPLPIVQPSRCTRWPMTHSSPTRVGVIGRGVHDRAVLDRRAGADHDAAGVAAQHGGGPHRRLGADGDLADHHRVRVDVGGGIDGRLDVAERVDGHGGSDREAAVAAAEEEQRRAVVGDGEVAHPAEHEVVVAGVGDRLDVAVDPGQDAVEDRRARAGRLASRGPRTCRRPCEANRRHTSSWSSARTFTQKWPLASIFGHDDEPLSGKKPTSGGSSDTEANEPTARPTGPSARGGGDHGDAGGEVPEHLAEPRRRRTAGGSIGSCGGATLAAAQPKETIRPSWAATTSSMPVPSASLRAWASISSTASSWWVGSWWNSARRRAPASAATCTA